MTRQSADAILLNDKSSGPNERTYVNALRPRTRAATKLWGSLRLATIKRYAIHTNEYVW